MIRSLLALFVLALAAGNTFAQSYPARTIRMIVPFTPGGGTDFVTRLVATKLADATRWTIVVENKPGAGGMMGLTEAARASPDGYDLVMGQADNLVIAPVIQKNLAIDPAKDLTPVALVASSPFVILTEANSPFKTLADVVRAAKASPKAVTYGDAGYGTFPHLVAELLQSAGGFKMEQIPYKGAAPAITDLLGGHISIAVLSIASGMPHIQAGKLRALAVTTSRRSSALPDVPTVAEQGFKDFDAEGWLGVLAPKGIAKPLVGRLNTEINTVMQTPEVRTALMAQGVEVLTGTPEEFATRLSGELAKWRKVVETANLKFE
jgi:tripartite-type tricarboxylate transporter receptor subunit TctC